jgi:hypothetical protein
VVKRPSTSWCATCLAQALGVTRHVVGNAYVTVERIAGFHREYGHCAGCGRRRLVVWYTNGAR